MTNLPGIYMRAPETWPFKTPTIPSKLVPSHKTYAPNNEGLVFVDPRDIATLLGLGFYLYGQTPDVNALLAGLPGAGDSSMFLAMDGVGRTPAGGGGSFGLVLVPEGTGTIDSPVFRFEIDIPPIVPSIVIDGINIQTDVNDDLFMEMSFDDGETWLCDDINYDSYVYQAQGGSAIIDGFIKVYTCKPSSSMNAPTFKTILFPGNETYLANGYFIGTSHGGTDLLLPTFRSFVVNQAATVTPTPARVTNIRFRPYGDGDAAGASPNKIATGTYFTYKEVLPA